MEEVSNKNNSSREYDLFKDSPVRYLGYANEVGESFRSIIPLGLVRLSYVIASGYVVCDAIDKGKKSWKTPRNIGAKKSGRYKETAVAFTDTLIWQAFASVAVPGFTINRICWLSGLCLQQLPSLPRPVQRWGVVATGLVSIPFIIRPIDNGVHYVMDRSLRKLYFN